MTLALGPGRSGDAGPPAARRWPGRKDVTLAEFGRETVIAHNDPSPARERVLRTFELKHAPINIQVALPSLEAIKRAVEMKMGVALLPKRCAVTELARGQLAAVKVQQVRLARQLRLVYRRAGEMSPRGAGVSAGRASHSTRKPEPACTISYHLGSRQP